MRLARPLTAVILALAFLTTAACSGQAPTTQVSLPQGFDLQSHRGGRDARPENTLPAFAYSLAVGVTTLELDIQITADGVPVVHHNSKLQGYLATNPWGRFLTEDEQPDIRYTDLADLERFDLGAMNPDAPYGYFDAHGATQKAVPGTSIATLEEVFQLIKDWGNDTVFVSVETKSTPYPVNPGNPTPQEWIEAFYAVVEEYGMQDRVMLQSFDWRTLIEMKQVDPSIATVALTTNQPDWNREGDEGEYQRVDEDGRAPWKAGLEMAEFGNDPVKAAASIDADVYSPYYKELTPAIVEQAQSLGMRVVPYTVNDPEQMRALIAMGVDGLITDRPATLRTVMEELGIPVPPKDPAPEGKPYFTGTDGL